MRTLQAARAKARLAELLNLVERGETVAITRHRETTAHGIPAPAGELRSVLGIPLAQLGGLPAI